MVIQSLSVTQHIMDYYGLDDPDREKTIRIGHFINKMLRDRAKELIAEEGALFFRLSYPNGLRHKCVTIDLAYRLRSQMLGESQEINDFDMWKLSREEFQSLIPIGRLALKELTGKDPESNFVKEYVWSVLRAQHGLGACAGICWAFDKLLMENHSLGFTVFTGKLSLFFWKRERWMYLHIGSNLFFPKDPVIKQFPQIKAPKLDTLTSRTTFLRGTDGLWFSAHIKTSNIRSCLNILFQEVHDGFCIVIGDRKNEKSRHCLYLNSGYHYLFDATEIRTNAERQPSYCLSLSDDRDSLSATFYEHLTQFHPNHDIRNFIFLHETFDQGRVARLLCEHEYLSNRFKCFRYLRSHFSDSLQDMVKSILYIPKYFSSILRPF